MTWETHSAKDSFQRFAEDWDRLNAKLYNSHPYFDSRFVGPLLDFFAEGSEKLCIHRDNDVISGALILQPSGVGRWSSFQPSQAQATALLLDDSRLLDSLISKLPGITWTIELLAIDPRYSPCFLHLTAPQITHEHARTIGIHLEKDFRDYWGKRPKKLISNMNRYMRRTENELGPTVLSQINNVDDMALGVKRFGDMESAGWKGAAGTAISADNQQGAFYLEVMRRFASTNQSTIFELLAGEMLTSSRLVIASNQMAVFLKTTYDETRSHLAVGRIMLYRVIEEQFHRKTSKSIEFYTNATRDQEEWATFACTINNIQIFKSTFFSASFTLLKLLQRQLKGRASRNTPQNEAAQRNRVIAFASAEAIREAEYDLSAFAPKDCIEISIDWFDLLQKAVYPNDPSIRYYSCALGKQPTTIIPLRLTANGRTKTIESLGNYYTPLFTPMMTDDEEIFRLKHILAAATRDHGGAHVMRFSPLDPESPVYKGLMNEMRAIGWIPFSFFCFGNWYLNITDTWDNYLKKRSANLRSSIKRRKGAFRAAGGALEIVTTPHDIEQAIADFLEVYSASWKTPEPYPEFVPSLIRLLCNNGMLRLGIARLQEKPVAAQIWIVAQKKASIYKLAYHEAYASYSPGTVLSAHLMRHVIDEDHVTEVDYLIGDDKYKRIWMSNRRERWGIVAYNPRTIIGFGLLIKEALGRTTKHISRMIKVALRKMKHLGSTPNCS